MERKMFLVIFLLVLFMSIGNGQITVSNCVDFQKIQYQAVSGMNSNNYTLMNDIDCCMLYNLNLTSSTFTGTIDGRNHTVKNLRVNNSAGAYLFFQTINATIQNIFFFNVSFISSGGSASILASIAYDTNLTNVQITGHSNAASVIKGCGTLAYTGALVIRFITGQYSSRTVIVKRCGVSYSNVISTTAGAGCVFQYLDLSNMYTCQTIFDEIFCTSSTTVAAGPQGVGGLFYHMQSVGDGSFFSLTNSYSSATLSSSSSSQLIGGIFAYFDGGYMNAIFNFCNVFSNVVAANSTNPKGSFIASSCNFPTTVKFENCFCDNTTSPSQFPPIYNDSNFQITGNITATNSSGLAHLVNSIFNSSIWNGLSLLIQAQPPFQSTNTPTTQTPTTNIPTTNAPTTQFASTIAPSTFSPSTNAPTTQFPTTFLTSLFPTTNEPFTQNPSTELATTEIRTSMIASTFIPTLQQTSFPSTCFYKVPNCQNCPLDAPLFDLNQGNVSCIFSQQQQEWRWAFTPDNGTLTNNAELILNGNTTTLVEGNLQNNANLSISSGSTVVVQGNFSQSSGGQTVFTFNQQQNNNKSSSLNVGGCVSVNGNISLNLQTQPQQGTTNLQVISYNCSQQVNISSSQIQVIPNYNGSSCDTINSQAINQQGSLGISLTSTFGDKCNGGTNLGLVIGLAVGIPCVVIVLVTTIISLFKIKKRRELSNLREHAKEEERGGLANAVDNPKFREEKTKWTENEAVEMK